MKIALCAQYEQHAGGIVKKTVAIGASSVGVLKFARVSHESGCVREQAQGYCGQPVKYHGMVDVLTKTVANEGFRGLYKVRLSLPWSVPLH